MPKTPYLYKREFNKMGFWTFNKDVKYWDVYDQDWSYRNEVFKLEPLRRYRMQKIVIQEIKEASLSLKIN